MPGRNNLSRALTDSTGATGSQADGLGVTTTRSPLATLATVHHNDGTTTSLSLAGRAAWPLRCLVEAGRCGGTTFTEPAPRWSGYVHTLRSLGIDIETRYEPHGGPFAGMHARYVLRSRVGLVGA